MPNKTIYVTAADLPLFEEAARRAGGLSPAIAAAIRHYLDTQGAAMTTPVSDEIELDVSEGAATVRTRFRGNRVARLRQTHDKRQVTYDVYRTAKGQFALYTVDRPDWYGMSSEPGGWEDPTTWQADTWSTKDRTLRVFADVEELLAHLPDDLADDARRASNTPSVRVLDI